MTSLVKHTKKRVLKLDSDMYAKMKKIFYLDAPHGQGSLSSSSSEVINFSSKKIISMLRAKTNVLCLNIKLKTKLVQTVQAKH